MGAGKALVAIDEVFVPNHRPRYKLGEWPEDCTLRELRESDPDLVLMVVQSSLQVNVDGADDSGSDIGDPAGTNTSSSMRIRGAGIGDHGIGSAVIDGGSSDHVEGNADSGNVRGGHTTLEDEENKSPRKERSRYKRDLFHEFDALPLRRDCPIAPAIYLPSSDCHVCSE